jgi:hypothetical protein
MAYASLSACAPSLILPDAYDTNKPNAIVTFVSPSADNASNTDEQAAM